MAERPPAFEERSPDDWSAERERLLQQKITDLGLKIEGTRLERIVQRLYGELRAAGITFLPKVYLSDEWSCPDGVPVIGIPFYLADERLVRIEDEMMDGVEAQTDDEILGYLRHEAGHAFNYAHKLYATAEWEALFGPFSRPYLEDFTPRPFSRDYVRHIPGWYAQKHPDEDFSESFAVWLTPGSNWQEVYRGWGCYPKLQYVERIVRERGAAPPLVTGEEYDFASEALVHSIAEHYRRTRPSLLDVPAYFDADLHDIFERAVTGGAYSRPEPAGRFLNAHRRAIIHRIAHFTGLYDVFVRSLIAHLIERCNALALVVDRAHEAETLIAFMAFATAVCMNKLHHGDFIAPSQTIAKSQP